MFDSVADSLKQSMLNMDASTAAGETPVDPASLISEMNQMSVNVPGSPDEQRQQQQQEQVWLCFGFFFLYFFLSWMKGQYKYCKRKLFLKEERK